MGRQRRAYVGKAAAESVRWEGSEERTLGRQRRAYDGKATKSVRWEGSEERTMGRQAKEKKKKTTAALSVDGRVFCYGRLPKEGKKYMGCCNLTLQPRDVYCTHYICGESISDNQCNATVRPYDGTSLVKTQ